jgi:hypothetical protein
MNGMTHQDVINAFPRRPIALVKTPAGAKTRRNALIIILLLFLPGLYWTWTDWQDQQLRQYLRTSGVEAEVVNSEGTCFSRRQISGDNPTGCRLAIDYRLRPEEGGGIRHASVWLDGGDRIFTPPALYDPANPARVLLKPEAERDLRWSEWIGPIVILLIPVIALLVWLFGHKGGIVDALRDPKPIIVPVDRFVRRPNLLEVYFRKPEGGKELVQIFAKGREPLLLHPPAGAASDNPWALALLASSGRPILLDGDLATLDLTEAERAAILGRR